MRNLKKLLQKLYPDTYEVVLSELEGVIGTPISSSEVTQWYKNETFYVVYPDAFKDFNGAGLKQLEDKIPYLKKLGIGVLHILPLLQSPMIDAGFDISDYLKVRDDLGGNSAFDKLLANAKKNGIRVMIDLVLNHISEKHEWFVQAQKGEEKYRNYFVYSKEKPKFIKKYVTENGPFADYEFNGVVSSFRIIFPEFVGELPHWVQGYDGYWYFHTFYPHQLDVDWNNPDVFIEFAKILVYWAKKGLSFRLDATIFLGKHVFEGEYDSPPNVHTFLQALHEVMVAVSPNSVFLAEAVEPLEIIKEYHGDAEHAECELTYNFPLMNNIWGCMITGNVTPLYKTIEESAKGLVNWAAWVTFIRNHDGLSLEYSSPEEIKLCHQYFSQNQRGEQFMAGFNIAGRTASFLDNDESKLLIMYMLLASLPGSPAIMYGDEIGKANDYEYMKKKTMEKQKQSKDKVIVDDLRDINRGQITGQDIANSKASRIYDAFCKIFTARIKFNELFSTEFVRIPIRDGVFSGIYGKKLEVFINISDTYCDLELGNKYKVIHSTGLHNIAGGSVRLLPRSGVWVIK